MDTEEALNSETAIWYTNYDNLKRFVSLFNRLPSKNAVDIFESTIGDWFNDARVDVKMYLSNNKNVEVKSLLLITFDTLSHLFSHIKSYDDRFMIIEDIIKKNKSLPLCSVSFIKTIRILCIWTMALARKK
jgi:hypothetical protein